ncbi:unnamed protein product [Polarella glacialis]|uniref:Uncharacterized protein n=1 Tax=Polarella glacialis TaxID=89957 RepID=A0A813LDV1_POLGL|nr:unnamed protein product [Polarella glacialis]
MERPVFRQLVSPRLSLELLPAGVLVYVRSPGVQQPQVRCRAATRAATALRKTSRHKAVRGQADSDAQTSLLMPSVKAVDYDDDVPTWTLSCSKVAALQHEGHPAIKAPKP